MDKRFESGIRVELLRPEGIGQGILLESKVVDDKTLVIAESSAVQGSICLGLVLGSKGSDTPKVKVLCETAYSAEHPYTDARERLGFTA